MRLIDTVIVHCSATPRGWMAGQPGRAKVDEIRRWHMDGNGWSDIGYHHVIDRDGTVIEGRGIERIGAHAKGHNAGSVGVCLIGGKDSRADDAFADHYTPAQGAALRQYLADMRRRFPGIHSVIGHNEVAPKACPGFRVGEWLGSAPVAPVHPDPAEQKPPRKSPAQSTTIQAAGGAAVAGAGGVIAAIGQLDPVTQYIVAGAALVVAVALVWIVRERLRKWAKGDR